MLYSIKTTWREAWKEEQIFVASGRKHRRRFAYERWRLERPDDAGAAPESEEKETIIIPEE